MLDTAIKEKHYYFMSIKTNQQFVSIVMTYAYNYFKVVVFALFWPRSTGKFMKESEFAVSVKPNQ